MANQEGINQDQMVDAGIDQRLATHSILATIEADKRLKSVLDAFRVAGMEGYLNGPDLATLFAPQNGFGDIAAMDDVALSSMLRGHLLGRAITEDELRTTTAVETLEETTLRVEASGNETRVDGARIVQPDIECTNGVIHVVDRPVKGQ